MDFLSRTVLTFRTCVGSSPIAFIRFICSA